MSSFSITFDTDALARELNDTARRQIPFATARALNATANDMQAGIRNRITGRGFVIRSDNSARWLKQQIRRNPGEDFATKRNQVARVRIANNRQAGVSLLSLIDQGGVRYSKFALGSGAVFGPSSVPVPFQRGSARPAVEGKMPRRLYPSMVGLQERRGIDGKFTKGALKGKRGVFAVRTAPQRGLVLQREAGQVRALFAIRPQVRVRPRQFFAPIAEQVALGRFNQNLDYALREALRTAR